MVDYGSNWSDEEAQLGLVMVSQVELGMGRREWMKKKVRTRMKEGMMLALEWLMGVKVHP